MDVVLQDIVLFKEEFLPCGWDIQLPKEANA
jgi:hypothetical protein